MEKKPIEYCRNCQEELPGNASFCPKCSQKSTDGRLTFGDLISQSLSDLLDFDGRIFQTLGALGVPGKLTKNFFEGKQVRYYHPVRLFILSTALFIGLLSLAISKSNVTDLDNIWKNREKYHEKKRVLADLDTLCLQLTEEYSTQELPEIFDSLSIRLSNKYQMGRSDSVELTQVISFNGDDNSSKSVAVDDLVEMSETDLADKYGVKDFGQRLIFLQVVRIQKSASGFLFFMLSNILWLVLIMMPMMAIILKMLYFKKSYLFIEHLIFLMHTHTFIFLLYGILLLLGKWMGYTILSWGLILIVFYLIKAIKTFYEQKWWVTLVKFFTATFLYFLVFIFSAFFVTLVSMLLF